VNSQYPLITTTTTTTISIIIITIIAIGVYHLQQQELTAASSLRYCHHADDPAQRAI
jgi:hypothetical protein